jgi:hypothetical protein
MVATGDFTSHQMKLLLTARTIFLLNQLLMFPLYYLPGLRGLLGGDDGDQVKFPASISWMTRKGAPRLATLILWNLGWGAMARAFLMDGEITAMSHVDWMRALFMLQMYGSGFVAVVLTPMQGPDVAMGSADELHAYAAMIYVANHVVANQYVLGVGVTSVYGFGYIATAAACGLCQFLRKDKDRFSRLLYLRMGRVVGALQLRFTAFTWLIELCFMITEHGLFLIFLVGMTSALRVV